MIGPFNLRAKTPQAERNNGGGGGDWIVFMVDVLHVSYTRGDCIIISMVVRELPHMSFSWYGNGTGNGNWELGIGNWE